jgi:hypothetical protein
MDLGRLEGFNEGTVLLAVSPDDMRCDGLVLHRTDIAMFGAPNWLWASIRESKRIKAVEERWGRCSGFKAPPETPRTLTRTETSFRD